MMRVCLVLGGADCLAEDVLEAKLALGDVPIVAVNDAGYWWKGPLTAWVSLHPDKFPKWRALRDSGPYRYYCHESFIFKYAPQHQSLEQQLGAQIHGTKMSWGKTSGSSTLMALHVALVELDFDHAVLCGAPMDYRPHFHNAKKGAIWTPGPFRPEWDNIPEKCARRISSMSGWTRGKFGPIPFSLYGPLTP